MSETVASGTGKAHFITRGDGIVVAGVGSVCVCVWRKDSILSRFHVQREALIQFVRRHKGTAGFLCVVEQSSGVPGEDVRKATTAMFEVLGKDLRATAMVIEGSGFRSAIVRSVASGIVMLMGKRESPISYFGDIDSASAWLAGHVEIVSVRRLVEGAEETRAMLEP